MKTIKMTSGDVKRVGDAEANSLIRDGRATFCPKGEWKKTRPAPKKDEPKKPRGPKKSLVDEILNTVDPDTGDMKDPVTGQVE